MSQIYNGQGDTLRLLFYTTNKQKEVNMFGKQFKDEDTDHEAPVVKTFGDGISASVTDPAPEEKSDPVVGRRMVTSEDQQEVKDKFKKLMSENSEIPITCISCDIQTYYHLTSVFPKFKSEIRWQNLRLDYK